MHLPSKHCVHPLDFGSQVVTLLYASWRLSAKIFGCFGENTLPCHIKCFNTLHCAHQLEILLLLPALQEAAT